MFVLILSRSQCERANRRDPRNSSDFGLLQRLHQHRQVPAQLWGGCQRGRVIPPDGSRTPGPC